MAEKQTSKDRMREIVDSIENGIKELFESYKYRQYRSTMSRFHRYSVNNTMLIYMPVSYTHLDVYKRQDQLRADSGTGAE